MSSSTESGPPSSEPVEIHKSEPVPKPPTEAMSNDELQGWLLVICQFIAIAIHIAIAVYAYPWPISTWILLGVGIGLLAWSALSLSNSLRIHPQPNENGLKTIGPYRWVRNPMYLALLVACLGIQLASPDRRMWIIYVFLSFVLLAKSLLEEEWCKKVYPGYDEYARRTKRLIPFLY